MAAEEIQMQMVEYVESITFQVVEGLSKSEADMLYAKIGDVTLFNATLQKWVRMTCVGNPPQLELEILN